MEIQPKAPYLARADQFLERLRRWAEGRDDVRALVVVGSFARGDARPDSDLDVVVLTRHASKYLQDTKWLSTFGKPEAVHLEPYGRVTSIRVLYDDGLEVEFAIAPADWASEPLDAGTEQVAGGGFVVLLDRDGHATLLASAVARLTVRSS